MYDSEFHEMMNVNDNADTLYAIAESRIPKYMHKYIVLHTPSLVDDIH